MTKYLQTAGAVAFFGPMILAAAAIVGLAVFFVVDQWHVLKLADLLDAAGIVGFMALGAYAAVRIIRASYHDDARAS